MKWTFKRFLGLILAALFCLGPIVFLWITSGPVVVGIMICAGGLVSAGIQLILKLIFDD